MPDARASHHAAGRLRKKQRRDNVRGAFALQKKLRVVLKKAASPN
jgi:predicted amidophosphoribosyltransferase